MIDSQAKHDAVATFTRDHLRAHLSDRMTVVQDVHPVTVDGGDAAEQKRVMGSPARYCEVLYSGDRRFGPLSIAGTPIETAEVFEINVWLEASRGEFADEQARFRAAIKGLTGLVTAFYRGASLRTDSGDAFTVGIPTDVRIDHVELRKGALAHFASFLVLVL